MAKKKFFEVLNVQGSSEATILLYDIIGEDWFSDGTSAKDFVTELHNLSANFKTINVRINSPGGSVWDGLAIINAIKQCKSKVITHNDGCCYSIAAAILLSGHEVKAAKNTRLMLHNAMIMAGGNAQDLRTEATVLDGYDDQICVGIADKTGMTKEEVKKKYFNFKDNYINASDARDLKMVDEITDEDAPGADNYKNMSFQEIFASLNRQKPENIIVPPIVKNQIEDNMKTFPLMAALLNLVKEGNTPTAEAIAAAQKELTDNDAGLVLISVEANKNFNKAASDLAAVQGRVTAIEALFGDGAKAEGFVLETAITDAIASAAKWDAQDGDEHGREDHNAQREEAPKGFAEVTEGMQHYKDVNKRLGN